MRRVILTKLRLKNILHVATIKHMQTYFRFIFNFHAGKDGSTKLLKPLFDEQKYSIVYPTIHIDQNNQNSDKIRKHNINISVI